MIKPKESNIRIESYENKDYRYLLKKTWDMDKEQKKTLVVIMHNPNVANEIKGDKSSNLCLNKAVDLKCSAIKIVNLYAKRSKKSDMLNKKYKIYDDNNFEYIKEAVNSADILLVAWGDSPGEMVKHEDFKDLLMNYKGEAKCFGVNKSKEPRHPAVTGEDTKLKKFDIRKYYKPQKKVKS